MIPRRHLLHHRPTYAHLEKELILWLFVDKQREFSVYTNALNWEGGKGWELDSTKIGWIQVAKIIHKDQLKAIRQETPAANL